MRLQRCLRRLSGQRLRATYAYEFVPSSYTYHAYVSCLNAHRIVAAVVARIEELRAA